MDIYTDYANWKFENHEFIHELVQRKSKTIARFSSVIVVVDYLYEKYLEKNSLLEEEEIFFQCGFDYIHDNFYTIKTLLDYQFSKNYDDLESCSKTINLLLYIHEFQSELLNYDHIDLKDVQQLDDFEYKINEFLDKKENVPDVYFPMVNDIIDKVFEKNNLDFQPIESIFYEAAIEYGIYKENDFDIFQSVFKHKKEQHAN